MQEQTNFTSAIIWMHGRGDVPSSWYQSVKWFCDRLHSNSPANPTNLLLLCKPICPPAPLRFIQQTQSNSTAWFDVLYGRPRRPGCKDDVDGIAESVSKIHEIIDNLIEKERIDPTKIFVGGYSQGAVMAIAATYSYQKHALGACVALSGWFPIQFMNKFFSSSSSSSEQKEQIVKNNVNQNTPLFWGHGTDDEIVVIENQIEEGEAVLKELKIPFIMKQYQGMEHDTNEEEMDDVVKFLQTCLMMNVDDDSNAGRSDDLQQQNPEMKNSNL